MRLRSAFSALAIVIVAACGGGAGADEPPATTVPGATTATTPSSTSPTTTTAPRTTAATTTTEAPRADLVIEVVVADGEFTAPDRPETAIGSSVLLIVESDITEEVHVHGYDLYLDVTPGTTGELEFVADVPGIFEVELEASRTLLFELIVR